jgi:hypothetical protein
MKTARSATNSLKRSVKEARPSFDINVIKKLPQAFLGLSSDVG